MSEDEFARVQERAIRAADEAIELLQALPAGSYPPDLPLPHREGGIKAEWPELSRERADEVDEWVKNLRLPDV